jgi:hypothetical protein
MSCHVIALPFHVMPCHYMPCLAISCLSFPLHSLSFHVMTLHGMPCLSMTFHAMPLPCLSIPCHLHEFTMLGMCYILCMCVCGCVRYDNCVFWSVQTRALSLRRALPRGVPEGGRYAPPPGYAQRSAPGGSPGPTGFGAVPRVHAVFGATPRNFFFGGFCYF